MNTEVNYEIGKLLAQKGFNEKVYDCFYTTSDHIKTEKLYSKQIAPMHHYPAPTIAEVIMWLYEKHSIWIAVDLIDNSRTFHFKYSITISNYREYHDEDCFDMAKTIYSDSKEKFGEPTEAYLSAITHTLKNLI